MLTAHQQYLLWLYLLWLCSVALEPSILLRAPDVSLLPLCFGEVVEKRSALNYPVLLLAAEDALAAR